MRVLLVIDDYGEMVYLQTLLKKLGFDVDSVQSQRAFNSKNLGFNPQVIIATADGRRVNGIEIAENTRRRQGFPKIVLLSSASQARELNIQQLPNIDGQLESPVNVQKLLQVIANVGGLDSSTLMEKYMKMRAALHPDEEGDLTLLKGEQTGTPANDRSQAPTPQVSNSQDGPGHSVTSSKMNSNNPASQSKSTQDPSDSSHSGPMGESLSVPPVTLVPQKGSHQNEDSPEISGQTGLSSELREARFKKFLKELPPADQDGFSREKVMVTNRELRRTEDSEALADLEEERRNFVRSLFGRR